MISPEEALHIVLSYAEPLPPERMRLDACLNRVLAADATSDMDMPPFDKSAMDGFACRRADLPGPFTIVETLPAGSEPLLRIEKGQCARIMTGGKVPEGADCVIKVEETQAAADGKVLFTFEHTLNNICYRGEDMRAGQTVLSEGTLLRPAHLAILASVGQDQPSVVRQLTVGILSTGDELVEPGHQPGPAGIRNSNATQLMAQCAETNSIATYYGIIPDTTQALGAAIAAAMEKNDLVLLTGGVSMGDFDWVPRVLTELGFTTHFNRLAVQPGRPTLFATRGEKACFGLPGNPVSSFVQFEMLAKPFIYRRMGHDYRPRMLRATLGNTIRRRKADRISLLPVTLDGDGKAFPLEYHGSAHIHAYVEADGIIAVPAGSFTLTEGEEVHVRLV